MANEKLEKLTKAIHKIPYLDETDKRFIDGYLTAKYEMWKTKQAPKGA